MEHLVVSRTPAGPCKYHPRVLLQFFRLDLLAVSLDFPLSPGLASTTDRLRVWKCRMNGTVHMWPFLLGFFDLDHAQGSSLPWRGMAPHSSQGCVLDSQMPHGLFTHLQRTDIWAVFPLLAL